MVSKLDYRITVSPSQTFLPSSAPTPSNSVSRVASSLGSSIGISGSDSSSTLRNKATGLFDNILCETITKIWNSIFETVSSCFTKIYQYFFGIDTSAYPAINLNLSKEALKKIYWGLGRENKWHECIDGRYHHLNDKYCFDKGTHGGTVEPGFIASMEETFTFVENFLNCKIDADWYLLLHKHTAAHFKGDANGTLMGQEKVGVFRNSDDNICCHLSGTYAVTAAGLAEFNALDKALKDEFGMEYGLGDMTYTDTLRTTIKLTYKPMSRAQVRRVFNKFLNEFYREVGSALTADQKLWAIAKLQQRLEWLHPVRDGTARTSTALMNKFLTDYGFHPAILEYPHVSSSYGLAQWKQYLQTGLIKWEQARARLNPTAAG